MNAELEANIAYQAKQNEQAVLAQIKAQGAFDDKMSAISASVMSDNSKINTRSNNVRPSIVDSSSAISGFTPI